MMDGQRSTPGAICKAKDKKKPKVKIYRRTWVEWRAVAEFQCRSPKIWSVCIGDSAVWWFRIPLNYAYTSSLYIRQPLLQCTHYFWNRFFLCRLQQLIEKENPSTSLPTVRFFNINRIMVPGLEAGHGHLSCDSNKLSSEIFSFLLTIFCSATSGRKTSSTNSRQGESSAFWASTTAEHKAS